MSPHVPFSQPFVSSLTDFIRALGGNLPLPMRLRIDKRLDAISAWIMPQPLTSTAPKFGHRKCCKPGGSDPRHPRIEWRAMLPAIIGAAGPDGNGQSDPRFDGARRMARIPSRSRRSHLQKPRRILCITYIFD